MGAVSSVVDTVSDVASGVGDIASGAIEGVSQLGSEVDDFVNEEIPGGWATVAAVTAATVGLPPTGAETAASGSAGSMAAADAVYAGANTASQTAGSSLLSPGLTATVAEAPILATSTVAPVAEAPILATSTAVPATTAAEGVFSGQGLTLGGGGVGLQAPTLPGLVEMGGAQGLSIPAAGGGTLGATGVGLAAGGLMAPVSEVTGLPLGQELAGIETGVGGLTGVTGATGGVSDTLGQRFLGNQLMATLFSPETIGGLLTGAGGLLAGEQDVGARRELADQLRAAGREAATQAQFRPVGITTRFGTSQFQVNPQTGQIESAGYTVSPEIQALQNRLMALSGTGLTQAEQAQGEFAPLTGAAQGLFGLGQQYLARSPQEVAQQYMERQQALLQPERERQLATIRNRLQRTGRTGLSVAQGGDLAASNPELQAYYNALAQQNAQLAAGAEQAGQQATQFGAGLFGTGANILGQRYAGQQAALTPFTQYLTGLTGLESQAMQPLALSSNLGQVASGAGARAGQLGLQGSLGAAQAMYPANAYSPFANILGGLGQSPLAAGLIGQGLGGLIGGAGSLFGGLSDSLTNASYFSDFGITPDIASIAI